MLAYPVGQGIALAALVAYLFIWLVREGRATPARRPRRPLPPPLAVEGKAGHRRVAATPPVAGVLTLYFDASAFTKLFLGEDGSERARELWASEVPLVTSWITLAETSAAIAAARRSRRLSRAAANTALRRLRSAWESMTALDADAEVCSLAGQLATRHALRGMDAVHVPSAVLVADARPIVVTWDAEVHQAARSEGLAVAIT